MGSPMSNQPLHFIRVLFILLSTMILAMPAHGIDDPLPGGAPINASAPVTEPDTSNIPLMDVVAPIDPALAPHIIVNVAARRLYFYDHGKVVKSYPVAVGSTAFRTPLGNREMSQIIWNPWWLPPDSGWAKGASPTPPGPNNPLGPVKMDLGSAILFHGTNKPKSIGTAASHGCMRMNSNDAKEFARFIQENYTAQNDPALFEQYEKSRGRSFYVKLENPIPVNIVYEIAEVRDGRLNVFKDVYYKFSKALKQQVIEQKLVESGMDIAKIDSQSLFDMVAKSKSDVELDLEAIKSGSAFVQPDPEQADTKKVAQIN